MFLMGTKDTKKGKTVLLYAGGIGIVVFSLILIIKPTLIIPMGVLMVVSMILLIKGFCDFISAKLEEIVGNKLESLTSDTSLDELAKINKATFMRVKKLNSDVEEVLNRSGMSKAEMEECNRLLSDEIAKRQMCIANIQIKRNVENTDALLNSNDKILGQFNQITRIVQKSVLEAEISKKEEPVAEYEPIQAVEYEPIQEEYETPVEESVVAEELEEAPMEEPVVAEELEESPVIEEPLAEEEKIYSTLIPEDSIEIMDDEVEQISEEVFAEEVAEPEATQPMEALVADDPNKKMTAEEIAALFNNL